MSTTKQTLIPLDLYKKIHKSMPILCVDVIIKSGNNVLLVKRSNKPAQGLWWFPGGRVLKGELLENTAIRKIKEEIGLNIKKVKLLGVEETMFSDGPFGWPTHTVNIVFLAELPGKITDIKLDNQSEDYKWFSKSEKSFHPYIKKFIRIAKDQ